MTNYSNHSARARRAASFVSICLFLCVFIVAAASAAEFSLQGQETPKTIVIDPGHGGHDTGVTGPGGISEKHVMLALARSLEAHLAPSFTVHLTRTGDYGLDVKHRTSLANNHGADLFISLHAGGSQRAGINRWSICHDLRKVQSGIAKVQGPFSWNYVQQRHIDRSIALARSIGKHLEAGAAGQPADIMGAPLAVLSGANMPAVLVEAGYLTHPVMAAKFSQEAYISELAGDIALGIFEFFEK
jgi:N-acetylmuramoyl-L-alanine amidase